MTKTVLVVEDEPIVRLLLCEVLGDAGFEVVEAKDGAEARARFSPRLDAVLLDIRLPDADGVELMVRFKAERPELPVLLMTGHGTPELERDARRLGADAFVNKPFSLLEMVATVRHLARGAAPA